VGVRIGRPGDRPTPFDGDAALPLREPGGVDDERGPVPERDDVRRVAKSLVDDRDDLHAPLLFKR
jgi:hypothetical protein